MFNNSSQNPSGMFNKNNSSLFQNKSPISGFNPGNTQGNSMQGRSFNNNQNPIMGGGPSINQNNRFGNTNNPQPSFQQYSYKKI
jgi:hypothetical protein